MSRGIPSVRTWLVRYRVGNKVLGYGYVNTINKRFAIWEANDNGGFRTQAYAMQTYGERCYTTVAPCKPMPTCFTFRFASTMGLGGNAFPASVPLMPYQWAECIL